MYKDSKILEQMKNMIKIREDIRNVFRYIEQVRASLRKAGFTDPIHLDSIRETLRKFDIHIGDIYVMLDRLREKGEFGE